MDGGSVDAAGLAGARFTREDMAARLVGQSLAYAGAPAPRGTHKVPVPQRREG